MAPHNLIEVVQALRHLINHPSASVTDMMRFIPGPDLPTGGKIIGLDGIRDMGNHLNGRSQIIAATFACDYLLIYATGRHIVGLARSDAGKAFIVSKIEIGFRPIIRHIDFAMLIG